MVRHQRDISRARNFTGLFAFPNTLLEMSCLVEMVSSFLGGVDASCDGVGRGARRCAGVSGYVAWLGALCMSVLIE
jgi:hypothetical protein